MRASFLLIASATMLRAQTLDVYSEFLRIGPTGDVVSADSTPNPREIISPAVVRGGFASFQVIVRAPRASYFLFIGVNPAGAARAVLYRQEFVNRNGSWIPDRLSTTREPIFGVIPDPDLAFSPQRARTYLLDVWVPPETPPGRLRLEVQMKAGSWTIYPMELRVLPIVVAPYGRSKQPLPDVARPAADAVLAPLDEYMVGAKVPSVLGGMAAPATLREAIRRNAEQDLSLAPPRLASALKDKMSAARSRGGEWFLAIRDLIYREAGGRE